MFFTSGGSQKSHLIGKRENSDFDYKEAVCGFLIEFGVPLRPAELAVIDFRSDLIAGFKAKRSPKQQAVLMVDTVRNSYKNDAGEWMFAT